MRCRWFQIKVRSSSSCRQVCIQRSVIEFLLGIRIPVVTTRRPASWSTASNTAVNFESRSRIRNFALAPASTGHDGLGLAAQERGPRNGIPCSRKICQTVEAATFTPRAASSPCTPSCSPMTDSPSPGAAPRPGWSAPCGAVPGQWHERAQPPRIAAQLGVMGSQVHILSSQRC
jgi:hypothetical protein